MLIKCFEPFVRVDSRILILGSFPSVKSREVSFYYGNKQNRFWALLSKYYKVEIPTTIEEKKELLINNHLALWDIVSECEIVGSLDSNIKNYSLQDLNTVLNTTNINLIICNGNKAYELYLQKYKKNPIKVIKAPSTSPANTRFDEKIWINALKNN